MRTFATLSVIVMVLVAPAAGQEARAVRVNGDVPVIDGRLDDPAWRDAPAVTEFVQRNPIDGAAPTESTAVRFLYTDHDLFVGFRGYESRPGRVTGRLVRRDQRVPADYFNVFIDSYYDRRTAFEFAVNPAGARRDVFIYDDGGGRDDSWDPVYDWSTHVDSLGWSAELRIPFSQLRFPRQDSLTFGIRLRRSINRRNEEVNWPYFPRDVAGEVSRYATLVGLENIPAPRRLELLPYSAGNLAFEPVEAGNPFRTGTRSDVRGGGDLKLGITSGLTLDLTVNPDFGQVEADPAVVNLTAFESFFPEKRPFFVEGTNLFQFPLEPSQGGGFGPRRGGEEGLVYTRRIGRRPQADADDAGGYADPPAQTTILGAAKVSGQVGGGWSVGLAQAVTAKEAAAVVDGAGSAATAPVEPLTSYSVMRAQRAVRRGRLAYGATATGLFRRLDEPVFADLHARAFSGGTDLNLLFGGDRYELSGALAGSRVEGAPEALVRTQRRSARYFQRPDQDYLTLDSSRTSLSGVAGYARLAKAVGFVTWELQYETRSPGFETNDLGFLRRADYHRQNAELELRWLEPGDVFRRFEWTLEERAEFSYGGERTETTVESRVSAEFLNYWNLNANVERAFPALATRLLRGGPAFDEPGRWQMRGGGRTDFRRPLSFNGGVNYTVEDASGARRWGLNMGVRWRPPAPFSLSLEGRSSWGVTDRQYVAQETVGDSTYYALGRLDRRELSITLRADVALSPRLSIELYAQPFVSAGRYGALALAADPRAAAYAQRFDPLGPDRLSRPGEADATVDVDRDGSADFSFEEPDFRVVSLRTNAVLRWEFLPGSTLFLVWQQDRRDRVSDGTLDLWAALRDGFRGRGALADAVTAEGTQVLAVKLAYWIGF